MSDSITPDAWPCVRTGTGEAAAVRGRRWSATASSNLARHLRLRRARHERCDGQARVYFLYFSLFSLLCQLRRCAGGPRAGWCLRVRGCTTDSHNRLSSSPRRALPLADLALHFVLLHRTRVYNICRACTGLPFQSASERLVSWCRRASARCLLLGLCQCRRRRLPIPTASPHPSPRERTGVAFPCHTAHCSRLEASVGIDGVVATVVPRFVPSSPCNVVSNLGSRRCNGVRG